nr:MAG TPA: hypothetical protein [Caudoviricetes sp.]
MYLRYKYNDRGIGIIPIPLLFSKNKPRLIFFSISYYNSDYFIL